MPDFAPDRIPAYSLFGQAAGLVEPRFCHVERIGDRWQFHGGRVEEHSHPHLHQCSFWLDGRGEYVADDARYPVAPGILCWMPSGVVHGFRVDPGSQAIVLSMSDDFAREQIGAVLGGSHLRGFHDHMVVATDRGQGDEAWLRRLFIRMEHEYEAMCGGQTDCIGALARLALIEGQRLAEVFPASPIGDADANLLLRFMALVQDRLGTRPRIEALATDLGSTPYLLNQVCQAALGMRASEVVRARHVQEAKRLLLFTALRVAQIGQILGFDDPAHFTRSFRNATGQLPRQWRAERTAARTGSVAEGAEEGG